MTQVADGVFAHVQPDGGWCVSNAGVVTGAEGALLIDTAATERRNRDLARRLGELGTGPVSTSTCVSMTRRSGVTISSLSIVACT